MCNEKLEWNRVFSRSPFVLARYDLSAHNSWRRHESNAGETPTRHTEQHQVSSIQNWHFVLSRNVTHTGAPPAVRIGWLLAVRPPRLAQVLDRQHAGDGGAQQSGESYHCGESASRISHHEEKDVTVVGNEQVRVDRRRFNLLSRV